MSDDIPVILLAEDSPVNQHLVAQILRRRGIEVEIVDNGQKAVERCQASRRSPPYDLVLMDIEMPILDGIKATRQIRALPHCQSMPVIALTGHQPDSTDDNRYCDIGMNDYLSKPVDVARLYRVVDHYCQTSKPVSDADPEARAESVSKTTDSRSDTEIGNTMTENRLINMDALLERVGGKLNFALHIMQIFFKSVDELETDLIDAVERLDRDEIRRKAHRIKGSMANVGFLSGSEAIVALEKGAQSLSKTEMRILLSKWKAGVEAIHVEFLSMAQAFMTDRKKNNPAAKK